MKRLGFGTRRINKTSKFCMTFKELFYTAKYCQILLRKMTNLITISSGYIYFCFLIQRGEGTF